MSDLMHQDFSTPQSEQNQKPTTIASAATIAPVNLVTFVTGTVTIATITPPVTGAHILILIFTNAAPGITLTSGNIQRAATPIQNVPVMFVYDPVSAKYWVSALA